MSKTYLIFVKHFRKFDKNMTEQNLRILEENFRKFKIEKKLKENLWKLKRKFKENT